MPRAYRSSCYAGELVDLRTRAGFVRRARQAAHAGRRRDRPPLGQYWRASIRPALHVPAPRRATHRPTPTRSPPSRIARTRRREPAASPETALRRSATRWWSADPAPPPARCPPHPPPRHERDDAIQPCPRGSPPRRGYARGGADETRRGPARRRAPELTHLAGRRATYPPREKWLVFHSPAKDNRLMPLSTGRQQDTAEHQHPADHGPHPRDLSDSREQCGEDGRADGLTEGGQVDHEGRKVPKRPVHPRVSK